jgi:cytochrome c
MKAQRRYLVALAVALVVAAPTDRAATPTTDAAARGALIYERCAACHALTFDQTGPRHCGLIAYLVTAGQSAACRDLEAR